METGRDKMNEHARAANKRARDEIEFRRAIRDDAYKRGYDAGRRDEAKGTRDEAPELMTEGAHMLAIIKGRNDVD